MGEVEMRVGGLRDEHRRHTQVDGRAVEIERVASRDHESNDRLMRAQRFELRHHPRQDRFGGGSSEHDQQLFLDVLDEPPDAEAVQSGDSAQRQEDEDEAGGVETCHQLAERGQRPEAVFADGEGHGAEGPDGRQPYDVADDHKQDVRKLVDEAEDQLPLPPKGMQGEAEEYRKEQHLQNVTLGERIPDAARNNIEQEVGGALHFTLASVGRQGIGIQGRGIDVHPNAWPDDVDDDEPEDERQRADYFKVEYGQSAGLAHRLHVFHPGDAGHHRAKDDRGDHHLDQLDEAVTERLHRRARFRVEMAEQRADQNPHYDLKVE